MSAKSKKGRVALVLLLLIAVLGSGFAYVVTQEFAVSSQQVDKELPHALLLNDA